MKKRDSSKVDKVYAEPITDLKDFEFNSQVAGVFQDMLERSIPGYFVMLELTKLLAGKFAKPYTNIYDLGCSLGETIKYIHAFLPSDCQVIGVEKSLPMVEKCKANLESLQHKSNIAIRHEDLLDTEIENASLVIMNLTLQFIPLKDRDAVLQKIANGLTDGGLLILFEKVTFEDADEKLLLDRLYFDFKLANGYSKLEIAQKREALENVLISDTIPELRRRAKRSGFRKTEVISQCLNFAGLMAVK